MFEVQRVCIYNISYKAASNTQCNKCSLKMHLNCISENHDRTTNIKVVFDLIGDDDEHIELTREECAANYNNFNSYNALKS